MGGIVLPNGHNLSMPYGNFLFCPEGNKTDGMFTIAETRRARLEELIGHFGTIASLNEALGYERNDTRLARIRNANARTDRPGKVFQMGDPQAREIEEKLALERGWMDTPPTAAPELAEDLKELHRVAEALEPYQIKQLIAIGTTLGQRHATPNEMHDDLTENDQTTGSPSGDARLVGVKSAVAKKIGRGYFGPPAAGPVVGE